MNYGVITQQSSPTFTRAGVLSLFVDTDIFYAPTVEPPNASLVPGLVTDADTFPAPAVVQASRWNSADKSANITLSGSDLVAAATNSTDAGVRAIETQNLDLVYFEFLWTKTGATGLDTGTGIARTDAVLANIGTTVNNASIAFNSGNIWNNGISTGSTVGGFSTGDVHCVALSRAAKLIWHRRNNGLWNGSGTANPALLFNGIDISAWFTVGKIIVPAACFNDANTTMTGNFGASAPAFTPPAGFARAN